MKVRSLVTGRSTVDFAQLVVELTAKQVAVEIVKERLTFRPDAGDPFATFQLDLVRGGVRAKTVPDP